MANNEKEANEKLYHLNASEKYVKKIGIFLVIFLLFFISNWMLPAKVSSEVTPKFTALDFSSNREATILSADWDKDSNMIELMLVYNNAAADGINEYYYAVEGIGYPGFRETKLEIEEVLNDPLCTVLHINNVFLFKELTLYLAPKSVDDISKVKDADTLTIVLSKNNLIEKSIYTKDRVGYVNERLDISIKLNNKRIERYKKKVSDAEEKITNLKAENDRLNESLNLLTGNDYNNAYENISNNKAEISNLKDNIIQYNIYIEDYEEQNVKLEESKASVQ